MEHSNWFTEYVAPYVNFLLFLGILVYFAKKPLALLASKRKLTFEAHFKAAADALNQAKQQLDEVQRRHRDLDREISELRKKAQADAQYEANRIVSEGKRLAEQIIADAQRMREGEFLEAKKQLEIETLKVAKTIVVEKLQKDFNESKDRSFVEDRILELSKINDSVMRGV